MDLLLTHGYFLADDEKEQQIMRPYPPLGILYNCSHLRAKGFAVEVFDSTFAAREDLYHLLRSQPPSVVGLYATLMTRRSVVEIMQVAREAGWRVVVGGPEPGLYAREYLACGADVVVAGEGEQTLEELLPALAIGPAALAKVNGIVFRGAGGEVVRTPPRAQIADIDAQPWPARDAIDLNRYLQVWRERHGQGSVALFSSRGCPYRCRWCSRAVFGNTHRRRSPAAVADELEFLIGRYQPEMVWMADDVFTIHHAWLYEYAAELQRRRVFLPFECISRADRLNERVLDTLAAMGCFRLWIGSESGSQRILDAMERGVTLEQVSRAVEMCRARGIASGIFLMWGYEGEELSDIEATIEHVKRVQPDVFFTTVAYPVRGTEFYNVVGDRLVNDTPWQLTSDRDNRIRGRHSRRFFQFADQLLYAEVELARAPLTDPARRQLAQKIAAARAGMQQSIAETEA